MALLQPTWTLVHPHKEGGGGGGGGAFYVACGQLKGPLAAEEPQGAKIRYYWLNFATVAKILLCNSFSLAK